jgi:hypothetical protein
MKYLIALFVWVYLQLYRLKRWPEERRLRKQIHEVCVKAEGLPQGLSEGERLAAVVLGAIFIFALTSKTQAKTQRVGAPKFGQYLLYLFLSKKDREYLIGDLDEEYLEVRAKFGPRLADIWYYKQVATSAWPMIRKAVRWGLLSTIGMWIRRFI